ncbi:MAG: hypothetical protein KGQ45_09740 [Burkholderiales bacterium]|nr:hypothetical protein [Burkholderiales bacterium]
MTVSIDALPSKKWLQVVPVQQNGARARICIQVTLKGIEMTPGEARRAHLADVEEWF